ncbi:hypothetical protein NB640_06225 [Oxalobacter vibrioformis]|uniref:Uncharacterized protein n=1 Tax=Oxalobacter vibrioformis TaxID=933080 RepID=A0A9E9M1T7_9BURK|nr:hypothetical protein [Oxalobacter vibrioformis]WAW11223.1 hypothetical protein NB640_06225 [Oxalobacter vibrioformis]
MQQEAEKNCVFRPESATNLRNCFNIFSKAAGFKLSGVWQAAQERQQFFFLSLIWEKGRPAGDVLQKYNSFVSFL